MSGHSHWATIKRSKAANDAKRGQTWSKIARKIILAAKSGGDPNDNTTLRYAVEEAKAANMPNDTIARAIKKGTGELASESYEQAVYEGYGPGGVAFIVDCLTDNRNRTVPEMRKIFERAGGQMGSNGCVAWMFEQKASFVIDADKTDEDTLLEIALEAGADDVRNNVQTFEVTGAVNVFGAMKDALAAAEIETVSAEIAMVPTTSIDVDAEKARQVLNLMEALEDHDDVQNVYANFDISQDVMAQIEADAK